MYSAACTSTALTWTRSHSCGSHSSSASSQAQNIYAKHSIFFPQESSDNLLAILSSCDESTRDVKKKRDRIKTKNKRYVESSGSVCTKKFVLPLLLYGSSSWHSKFECERENHSRGEKSQLMMMWNIFFFFIISSIVASSLALRERPGTHRKKSQQHERVEKSRSLQWTSSISWVQPRRVWPRLQR